MNAITHPGSIQSRLVIRQFCISSNGGQIEVPPSAVVVTGYLQEIGANFEVCIAVLLDPDQSTVIRTFRIIEMDREVPKDTAAFVLAIPIMSFGSVKPVFVFEKDDKLSPQRVGIVKTGRID